MMGIGMHEKVTALMVVKLPDERERIQPLVEAGYQPLWGWDDWLLLAVTKRDEKAGMVVPRPPGGGLPT